MELIPRTIVVNTGEQKDVARTIDNFFIDTKKDIERFYEVKKSDWKIQSGNISYNSNQITDDRITYLLCQDVMLAGVFERRTEFNRIEYSFFRSHGAQEKLEPKR